MKKKTLLILVVILIFFTTSSVLALDICDPIGFWIWLDDDYHVSTNCRITRDKYVYLGALVDYKQQLADQLESLQMDVEQYKDDLTTASYCTIIDGVAAVLNGVALLEAPNPVSSVALAESCASLYYDVIDISTSNTNLQNTLDEIATVVQELEDTSNTYEAQLYWFNSHTELNNCFRVTNFIM